MPYELKPLSCNPARLNGLSEKLINNLSWTAAEAAFAKLGA